MDVGDTLQESFNTTFKINSPTDTLYHYTSLAGLKGILTSKTFWLTDYRFLNDSSEINYSRAELLKIINKIFSTLPASKLWIKLYYYFNILPHIHLIYVFSMCEREDYLPAWRAYANDGSGFAIGINPKLFTPSTDSTPETPHQHRNSAKIHYNINIVENYLQDFFKKINSGNTPKNERELISIIISHLVALYPIIKHQAYQEEVEYRLFQFEEKKEEFDKINANRNLIVPEKNKIWSPSKYSEDHQFVNSIPRVVSPQFDTCDIQSIWIGPKCNKEHAKNEIQKILDEQGYKTTEIKFSSIPYR